MFKCTICQKLHDTRVEYCDCGNDVFEEVPDISEKQSWKLSFTPQQLLSCIIFLICIIFSCWVMFGINFKASKQPHKNLTKQSAKQINDIPQIDEIWDDTPPGGVLIGNSTSLDLYKSRLEKALYSNLEVNEIFEDGRCVIEFKINEKGKLTNRRLYKEKGSMIFNNNIIKMMKRTSNVINPPSGYENTKFTADVYTSNGVIKIDLR